MTYGFPMSPFFNLSEVPLTCTACSFISINAPIDDTLSKLLYAFKQSF